MHFQKIKELENQYVMNTYGRVEIALEKGEGSILYDTEGNSYIDLTSGIGVNSLGYHHPALTQAIQRQAEKLMHCSNIFYSQPMAEVAEILCWETGLSKVFFANSGAEANEGMIKLARKYSTDKYGKERNKILSLRQSFHGRTMTTLMATGQDKFHKYFYPFPTGFDYVETNHFEDFISHVDDTVCGIMMEMIQGEGGVLPLDKDFVQQVTTYCQQKDILVMIDEVQTGIGRTGTLFCYEQYDIQPDIISVAKGLAGGVPMGGFVCNEKCADVLQPGMHGSTFGGNLLASVAAQTVLHTVNDPTFLQTVKEKGDYFKQNLLPLEKIKTVRGKGLMLGIIVDPDQRADYVAQLREKGVLVLTAGTDAIRLLPPLVITYEEIDQALAAMKEVFA